MLDHEVDEPPEETVDRHQGRIVGPAFRFGRKRVRIAAVSKGGGEAEAIESPHRKGELELDETGNGIGKTEPARAG